MTGDSAVCAFARSLFRYKLAIVLDGEKWEEEFLEKLTLVVKGVHMPHQFDIVHGPPKGQIAHPSVETGPRYLGDECCWLISRDNRG